MHRKPARPKLFPPQRIKDSFSIQPSAAVSHQKPIYWATNIIQASTRHFNELYHCDDWKCCHWPKYSFCMPWHRLSLSSHLIKKSFNKTFFVLCVIVALKIQKKPERQKESRRNSFWKLKATFPFCIHTSFVSQTWLCLYIVHKKFSFNSWYGLSVLFSIWLACDTEAAKQLVNMKYVSQPNVLL